MKCFEDPACPMPVQFLYRRLPDGMLARHTETEDGDLLGRCAWHEQVFGRVDQALRQAAREVPSPQLVACGKCLVCGDDIYRQQHAPFCASHRYKYNFERKRNGGDLTPEQFTAIHPQRPQMSVHVAVLIPYRRNKYVGGFTIRDVPPLEAMRLVQERAESIWRVGPPRANARVNVMDQARCPRAERYIGGFLLRGGDPQELFRRLKAEFSQ